MDVQFVQIYSGKIVADSGEKILVEYKIISPVTSKYVFKKVKFHCAWFLLQCADPESKMINYSDISNAKYNLDYGLSIDGPLTIDPNLIKNGQRVINDGTYPELANAEITDIVKCNNPILIMKANMFNHLRDSIELL